MSGKACLWYRFIIKILVSLLVTRMSSDNDHRRAHLMPMTRDILYMCLFCHLFFSLWLSNLFCFTLLLRMGIIQCMLCSTEEFFKRVDQSYNPLWCVISKVTHMLAHMVFKPCFCFQSLPRFALNNLRNYFFWLCQRLVSLSFTKTVYTSICLIVLFFQDPCLHLSHSLLTLFAIWHSGTTWFKHRFSRVSQLTILHVVYATTV